MDMGTGSELRFNFVEYGKPSTSDSGCDGQVFQEFSIDLVDTEKSEMYVSANAS
jgi:hypothetical protein